MGAVVEKDEQDDVLIVGWLRGDDYEAALAYRRADRQRPDRPASPPAENPPSTSRLTRRPDGD